MFFLKGAIDTILDTEGVVFVYLHVILYFRTITIHCHCLAVDRSLGIVLSEAKSLPFSLPLAAMSHQQFIHGSACGYGKEADAAVVKIWERTAGVSVVSSDKGYSPEQIAQDIVAVSNTVEQIGFIGLGAMGFGMATQLVHSNYRVFGFDVYEPTLSRFSKAGGLTGKSPAEVAKGILFCEDDITAVWYSVRS
eukprot:Gb_23162 [translate_table: standard]